VGTAAGVGIESIAEQGRGEEEQTGDDTRDPIYRVKCNGKAGSRGEDQEGTTELDWT
jgi:hypothetical protein